MGLHAGTHATPQKSLPMFDNKIVSTVSSVTLTASHTLWGTGSKSHPKTVE